jgi:serine/threonine protein kinase
MTQLFEHIAAKGHYRERDAAHLMRTLLAVVEHCHNMNVVHRDLKVRGWHGAFGGRRHHGEVNQQAASNDSC